MTQQPADLDTARRVLAEHQEELWHRYPGVVGMSIGAIPLDEVRDAANVYRIVIYLRERDDEPAGPQSVAGVPITFLVTGQPKAYLPASGSKEASMSATRRGFITATGSLAAVAVTALPVPAVSTARSLPNAAHQANYRALAEAVTFHGPVIAEDARLRRAYADPDLHATIDAALDALGRGLPTGGFAALDVTARRTHLAGLLRGADASKIETAIGLVLAGRPDAAAGRTMSRTLQALASAGKRSYTRPAASYVI